MERKSIKEKKEEYKKANSNYFEGVLQIRDFSEEQFNEIIDYIEGLGDVDYNVKIVTEKGNMFGARLLPKGPKYPGYYYPLRMTDYSWIDHDGSKYIMRLYVNNYEHTKGVVIDYVIVTTQYTKAGTPSQIKVINIDPDVAFPFEGGWDWESGILDFSAGPGAVVVKVELIDHLNHLIGAHYFEMEIL